MMLKRLSMFAASALLVSFSVTAYQPPSAHANNQLLKKLDSDAVDPKNWEYFDYTKMPDKTLLVPRPEALSPTQLKYNDRPAFPYDPTITPSMMYTRGKDQPPTLIFVKAGDPVIVNGKVFWSSMTAEQSKRIDLDNGDYVDIWTVTAYTPLLDFNGVANIADIQPWRPDRVFKKGTWQDLIFTDPNEAITISGQSFTAPAAGEKTVVKVKDKEGKSHQVTLWSVFPNSIQPNKIPKVAPAPTKKKKKKTSTGGAATTTAPGAAPSTGAPASTPASTTPAVTPATPSAPATTPAAPPAAPSSSAPSTTPPAADTAKQAAPEKSALPKETDKAKEVGLKEAESPKTTKVEEKTTEVKETKKESK